MEYAQLNDTLNHTVKEIYDSLIRALPKLKEHHEVIICGFGKAGRVTLAEMERLKVSVTAILDNDPALSGKNYLGIPIYPVKEFAGTDIPVVISSSRYYVELFEEAKELGLQNTIPYFVYLFGMELSPEAYSDPYSTYEMIKHYLLLQSPSEGLSFKSIDISITEKCSLKCRDCANLMQYFRNPVHEDIDICMTAAKRFLETVDRVHRVNILGGEPFLNPELRMYLEELKKYTNYDKLAVLTNATILPDQKTLDCMRDKRIFVQLSDYGLKNQRVGELKELLSKNNIRYLYYHDMKWSDFAPLRLYDRTMEENKRVLMNCASNTCVNMKHGKLYRCAIEAGAAALGAVPASIIVPVDLLDFNISREDLRELLKAKRDATYLPICDYCAGRPIGLDCTCISAGIQIKEPIPYHFYKEGR